MALTITSAQVYARLRTLIGTDFYASTDIADYFIVDATAYVNKVLSNAGKDYDDLTTDEQTICKNIAVLYACSEIIESAPEPDYADGPISEKAIKPTGKVELSKQLQKKIKELFSLISVSMIRTGATYSGGDDYVSDGNNKKNIDFTDSTKPFSVWS